jgi:hypothetical protein
MMKKKIMREEYVYSALLVASSDRAADEEVRKYC